MRYLGQMISIEEKYTQSTKQENIKKLKRTPESGHSYERPIIFDTIEEYLQWCKEEKLYED